MPNVDFTLTIGYIELHKLLKFTGVTDSDDADKAVVAGGMVTIGDQSKLRKTAKIRADQIVMLGDVRIAVQGFD